MRRKIPLLGLGLLTLLALSVALSAPPAPRAQADATLQGAARLDGFKIYFTEANTEASRFDRTATGLSRLAGLLRMLGAELYTLEWRTGIPANADLIVIAGPRSDLSAEQTAWLWTYLQKDGGRLLLLADANIDALRERSGLVQLLWTDMGVRPRDDVVVTEGPVKTFYPAPARTGRDEPTSTPAPPFEAPSLIAEFLTTNLNPNHPITQGIEDPLAFFVARSLEVDETSAEPRATSLVLSSRDFYGEIKYGDYLNGYGGTYNINEDRTPGELPLVAALESATAGYRIVLIGDREFATNGGGLQTSPPYSPSFLYPGNVRFLLKTIAWLLEADAGLADEMSFPTPGPTATPTVTPSPTPSPVPEGATGS